MPLWARRDEAATKAARKEKRFVDRRSWIGVRRDGSLYLRLKGKDKEAQYDRLHALWDGNCGICGQPVRRGDEDLEHRLSLGNGGDDQDPNLRFTHSMWSTEPCHRAKHGREIHLRAVPNPSQWTSVEAVK